MIFSHSSARARQRRAAQRAGRRPAAAAEERRRRDGDVRARASCRRRSPPGTSCRDGRANAADAAVRRTSQRRQERGSTTWDKANPAPRATLADAADHIDHISKVAGIDHIGLGGDFDGITSVPLGPRGRLEVSGADRRAAAARLQGRRGQEDPRPEHPARDARGREGVGATAEGARGVADAVSEVVPRTRDPRLEKSDLDHPHRRARRLDDRRHAGVQVAARGAPERARRRDEPVRVLADASREPDWEVLEPRRQRRAQRSDCSAVRARRHRRSRRRRS